jgi:ABC-type sugar transport system ATPase subunit
MVATPSPPASSGGDGVSRRRGEAFLAVEGLVKVFPGTRALDGVDITVRRGEIHALLGENGAGKSTLIRQICGASQPTEGRLLVEGREVSLPSPHAAAAALGIAVVHQHFNLVPQITVCENLFLTEGLPRRAGVFVNWGHAYRQARTLLSRVGLDIDPRTAVSQLRPDEAAMVAIAKAIGADARLIILDEPTAALLPGEVGLLFGHMRRPAAEGHAFLYVSHRLAEVFDIADCVTVLRDGRNAGHWRRSEMSRGAIINAIVGQKGFTEDVAAAPSRAGDVLLRAEGLGGGRVARMSFELRAHEILGIAGLPGSGAEEALDLLYGRFPATGGRLTVGGADVAFRSPRGAKRAGLALAPKDRHAESLLPGATVRENISLPNLRRFATIPVLRIIRRDKERAEAQSIARRLSVKMAGVESPISSLSGGNQQKTILGRWLASGAKVFLLNSPTAAVDIGAKAEIYALIRQIAHDGAGVIFTSTEVEEFPRVCHRVRVVRDGLGAGELVGRDATEANILNLAAGGGE